MNQSEARAAVVEFAESLKGRSYGAGGGHMWKPGQNIPNVFDCSGFSYVVLRHTTGINLDPAGWGTSESQWQNALGGRVADSDDLLPGMLVFFTDTTYADPGHVGIIVSYDPKTRSGIYVSAYDTAEGVIDHSYTRGADTWYGATDPISTLPTDPTPIPSTEDDMVVITQNPNNKGQVVLDLGTGKYYGLSNPAVLAFYKACGVKVVPAATPAVFDKFTQAGTI